MVPLNRDHTIGPQIVEAMAGFGVPEANIAVVIWHRPETLRKHFRESLTPATSGWREPVGVREYPIGKKEAQQLAAKTAAVGTEWEEFLERHAALSD